MFSFNNWVLKLAKIQTKSENDKIDSCNCIFHHIFFQNDCTDDIMTTYDASMIDGWFI